MVGPPLLVAITTFTYSRVPHLFPIALMMITCWN